MRIRHDIPVIREHIDVSSDFSEWKEKIPPKIHINIKRLQHYLDIRSRDRLSWSCMRGGLSRAVNVSGDAAQCDSIRWYNLLFEMFEQQPDFKQSIPAATRRDICYSRGVYPGLAKHLSEFLGIPEYSNLFVAMQQAEANSLERAAARASAGTAHAAHVVASRAKSLVQDGRAAGL